uniref:Uncharacterized protein n=1 Tax=Anguilla anguilla TaxID=7936 RepID=A0A0E9WH39_ANGAN
MMLYRYSIYNINIHKFMSYTFSVNGNSNQFMLFGNKKKYKEIFRFCH